MSCNGVAVVRNYRNLSKLNSSPFPFRRSLGVAQIRPRVGLTREVIPTFADARSESSRPRRQM